MIGGYTLKLKLEEIGKLSHGMTLARIQAKPGEVTKELELFTMQALNKEIENYKIEVESHTIAVSRQRLNQLNLSYPGMVLFGLTSRKSFVINEEYEGRVIPSNFAFLECDETLVNPYYLVWYFNESPEIKKQLRVISQGSIIGAISVQMLRDLKIEIPNIKTQVQLGSVYQLIQKKKKLEFEKRELEELLMNQVMISCLKGE